MTKIAQLISLVFHPILMPLVGFIIIFNCGVFEVDFPVEVLRFTYLMVTLFSIFLPLSVIPFLIYWNLVQNIEANKRQERFAPLLVTVLSLALLYFVLRKNVPISLISLYSIALAISAIVLFIFNFFSKISMHLLGLGGITGLMAVLSIQYSANLFFWLSIVIFISGLVASARLYLQAHKVWEIITGYFLGFTIIFGIIYFNNFFIHILTPDV